MRFAAAFVYPSNTVLVKKLFMLFNKNDYTQNGDPCMNHFFKRARSSGLPRFLLGSLLFLSIGLSFSDPKVQAQSPLLPPLQASKLEPSLPENPIPGSDAVPFTKDDPLLLLVNRENPLPDTAEPELVWSGEGEILIAAEARDSLQQMLEAGRQEGLDFVVCSGYRSAMLQQQLFEEDLQARMAEGLSYEAAWTATAQYTLPPGCSEHNTGLAVDIVSLHNQNLDETQEQTAETRWLQEHCSEYGFILRYPKEKEALTGISYESWHYRFVGIEAAKYLTEHDLSLEELHSP